MAYLALVRHVVRVGREPRAPGKGKAAQPTQGKTLAPAAHHALGDLVSGVVDLVGAPEGDGGEKGRGGGERWEWVMPQGGKVGDPRSSSLSRLLRTSSGRRAYCPLCSRAQQER